MWVQLRAPKQIRQKGNTIRYQPGDWVSVGKHVAQRWLADGEAVLPSHRRAEILPGNAGVVITGHEARRWMLEQYGDILDQVYGSPQMPWQYNLIWDGQTNIAANLIPTGFNLLETWQVAVPLLDYNKLALHLGTDDDRERTRAVVHDLRIPVYACGAMWVRRCPATEELMSLWQSEPGNRDLAFLRALYKVTPLVLALPSLWTGKGAEA